MNITDYLEQPVSLDGKHFLQPNGQVAKVPEGASASLGDVLSSFNRAKVMLNHLSLVVKDLGQVISNYNIDDVVDTKQEPKE